YTYGDAAWRDKLTSYNGQAITYDAIGNPLSYRGRTLTWTNGRQLAKVNSNISYTYTPEGTRLSKTVNGLKTEYTLDGSLIMSQKTGNQVLNYYYDSAGKVVSIGYKSTLTAAEVFYFVSRNNQGDIIALYNSSNSTLVGTYSYDAWGRILATTKASASSDPNDILTKNPFRYRGYYYDTETSWYYLQSRYYDPAVRRFISSDDASVMAVEQGHINQYNLYSYCLNNPVNMTDGGGYLPSWTKFLIGGIVLASLAAATVLTGGVVGAVATAALAGATIGGGTSAVSAAMNGGDVASAFLGGVATGMTSGISVINPAAGIAASAVADTVNAAAQAAANGRSIDTAELVAAGVGGAFRGIGYAGREMLIKPAFSDQAPGLLNTGVRLLANGIIAGEAKLLGTVAQETVRWSYAK
ncbi:RHS repeat-associated core domain-containing protein, partial [Ruminococcaceae bacterium OttesenSCG-928-A11]|nr:RHS repeat-associated core domain-containing protein [Ruminococcaceae bacterium OttesenSCG-928-A11]